MAISRRTFLLGTGGVLAVGAAAERTTAWARRRPVRRWVERVATSASARDLGVEYLTRHPAEADTTALLGLLAGLVFPLSLLGGPEREPAGFNERLRQDFAEGDTVRMGGWLLSRTELRLCALAALELEEEDGTTGVFAARQLTEGDRLYWTAPTARFRLPADMTALEFRLRSGSREPQRVAVRIGGEVVDELAVSGSEWQRARYVMRPIQSTTTLELTTTPEWKPAFDFRTIGVGVDRVWSTRSG